ncbi:MAG: methyltransferase [Candidatus Altiarchaeales archaeon]|nr:methyltransferase [Candidatus Altiarchaeales archaeon]
MLYFRGYSFKTHPKVYEPAEDSFLLADNLIVNEGDRVLDVGTGVGIMAVVASEKASRVVAVDVNPKALEITKENADINNCWNIETLEGDLFTDINPEERFDLIAFNPPYLPVMEGGLLGRSWSGGVGGREVIKRFLAAVGGFLKPDGMLQIVVSSVNDPEAVRQEFRRNDLILDIVAEKRMFFETLYVLKGSLQ